MFLYFVGQNDVILAELTAENTQIHQHMLTLISLFGISVHVYVHLFFLC